MTDEEQWWIATVGLGERGPVVSPDALTPVTLMSSEYVSFVAAWQAAASWDFSGGIRVNWDHTNAIG